MSNLSSSGKSSRFRRKINRNPFSRFCKFMSSLAVTLSLTLSSISFINLITKINRHHP